MDVRKEYYMRCDAKNEDPQWLYEDYIKDLILVSRCGNSDTRFSSSCATPSSSTG